MSASSAELPGLGGSLAISFLSLGLVCVLAYLALRWLSGKGLGRGGAGPIQVRARCALEPRRSLYVIETAGRCFLVGVGEGPMAVLAELDPERFAAGASNAGVGTTAREEGTFARVLREVMRRPPKAPAAAVEVKEGRAG